MRGSRSAGPEILALALRLAMKQRVSSLVTPATVRSLEYMPIMVGFAQSAA
jgi:hypothetical protein